MKVYFLALAMSLSFSAVAQTIELPRVEMPDELSSGEFAEGTITRLTPAEVAEFLPWAQNSRNTLNRALTQSRSLPLRERLPHIERAVRAVVSRSGSRQYQMLMRFSLNRGLLLVDELERNIDMNLIGSQENALDILQRSITVALSFYESDLTFQQRAQGGDDAVVIPHAQFGTAFMQGMYAGVVNVLDATAQYRLLYKLIEMVNWDLSRDANAPRYAESIVEAYEMGQDLPEQPRGNDRENLRMIRRLNSLKIINLRTAAGAARAQNVNEADMPITQVLQPTGTTYGPGADPNRRMIRCETSSNGYNFNSTTRDRDLSLRQAIAQCQSSGSTNNAECAVNYSCDDSGGYAAFVRCETSSNGYNFNSNTRDRNLSLRQAIAQCQSSGSTNNSECAVNYSCNDGGGYSAFVRCETSSNGYNFNSNTRDRALSLRQAIAQCQSSGSTNNSECAVNYSCNDGQSYPAFARCETTSNGYRFSSSTRDRELSLRQAISRCQASGSTNNSECSANWTCH